jgi:membrane protein YdbS with pleckstrin-like domain
MFIAKRLILWAIGIVLGGLLLSITAWRPLEYLAVAVMVVPVFFVLTAEVRRRCTTLQLDLTGIHLRRGVFVKRITIIPLPRIATVDIRQGLLSRMLSIGDVTIHSNDASEDELFPKAHHPEQLQSQIATMIQTHGQGLNQALT